MARQKKRGSAITLIVLGCLVVVGASAAVIYLAAAPAPKSVATAAVKPEVAGHASGMVLVPDGQGTCHKYVLGNDTGKSTYAGTAACDSSASGNSGGARSNLPPALRGMQQTLGR